MNAPEKYNELGDSNKDEEDAQRDSKKSVKAYDQKSRKIIWRVVNGSMMLFFIMASGVQFNDPDPYLWVPFYGTAALLTAIITFRPGLEGNKWWRHVYAIHVVFSFGMFVYVLVELFIAISNPQSDGTLNPLTYEEGRELAGIMITSIWLFACQQLPTIRSFNEGGKEFKTYGLIAVMIVFSLLPLFLWCLCSTNVLEVSYLSLCTDF